MIAENRKLKSFINRLLELSKTDGIVDAEKVSSVLKSLKQTKVKSLRSVLEMYRFSVKKDLQQTTARVSYAGVLSDATQQKLLATLESKTGRKLVIETREDPSLIAGINVAVGDYVYDSSAKRILQQISETI